MIPGVEKGERSIDTVRRSLLSRAIEVFDGDGECSGCYIDDSPVDDMDMGGLRCSMLGLQDMNAVTSTRDSNSTSEAEDS